MENPNPMFLINPIPFKIEDTNLVSEQLYGYTIEELRNMTIQEINKLSEKKSTLLQRILLPQNNAVFPETPHKNRGVATRGRPYNLN